MEDYKLEFNIAEEEVLCENCDLPILKDDLAYIRKYVDSTKKKYFCSRNCLDEYETKEVMAELHQDENYYFGYSE